MIVLYRPPGNTYNTTQNDLLAQALESLTCHCQRVVVLGDFNLPTIDWQSLCFPDDQPYNSLCNFIFNGGLHQIVDFPTRSQAILDLVLVNDPLLVSNLRAASPIATSDHNSILFKFYLHNLDNNVDESPSQKLNTSITTKTYFFHDADWQSFNNHLQNLEWLSIFGDCRTVDDYWLCFKSVLYDCIELYVPFKAGSTGTAKRSKSKYPISIRKLMNK